MSGYQEEIEVLVDCISQLILAVVTDELEKVQAICNQLALSSSKVVRDIQTLAIEAKDGQLQKDITEVIGKITNAVSNLIKSLTQMLQAPGDVNRKKEFAEAAKGLGEAINDLIVVSDTSFSHKITMFVKQAIESSKVLSEVASKGGVNQLDKARNAFEVTHKNLLTTVACVVENTANTEKRNMLMSGMNSVQNNAPIATESAEALANDPNNNSKMSDLTRATRSLTVAYKTLIDAAKINPLSYIDKVHDTMDTLEDILLLAQELEMAALALHQSSLNGSEDFMGNAKKVAQTALKLVEEAQNSAENSQSPILKLAIQEACARIRKISPEFIAAAREAQKNPTKASLQELQDKQNELDAAILMLKQASDTPVAAGYRFNLGAKYLEQEADALKDSALQGNYSDVAQHAKLLAELSKEVEQASKEIRVAGKNKEWLENSVAGIKSTNLALVNAALERAKARSNDEQRSTERNLEEAHARFIHEVENAKRSVHGEEPKPYAPKPQQQQPIDLEDASLLEASLEEARLASSFASQAKELLEGLTGDQAEAARGAIRHLLACAEHLTHCANQFNITNSAEDKQLLVAAQQALASAMQDVIKLVTKEENFTGELRHALDMLQENFAQQDVDPILEKATGILKMIQDTLLAADCKTKLDLSKQTFNEVRGLCKLLKELAATTEDKSLQAKITDYSNIINDCSLQVKIITCVKAASGAENTDQVKQANAGLKRAIKEVMEILVVASLKSHTAQTVNQVRAISRVLEAWKDAM